MTARRVLITQERIVQVDDSNELRCGERCQFLRDSAFSPADRHWCKLDGTNAVVRNRNRTEACTSGEVRP